MPHVNDVQPTSHDRHDPLLVAALAADDLAADERDQATALIHSCADCATLHADLLALAQAVAAAAPPIATRPRDFRLTPADAARLRPSGWRRFTGALSFRPALTRPLGVGLATLGLVGLLVGNVQLGAGAGGNASVTSGNRNAAGPEAMPAASAPNLTGGGDTAGGALSSAAPRTPAEAPAAAASVAVPAASSGGGYGVADQSVQPDKGVGGVAAPGASGPTQSVAGPVVDATVGSGDVDLFRLQNLLSGGAIVLGLVLLVASRRRGRATA